MEIPNPASAKAEAHWLTASSLAPAASIINTKIKKYLLPNSSLNDMPRSPSGRSEGRGTRVNTKVLAAGIIAHSSDKYRHWPRPAITKNSVLSSTTLAATSWPSPSISEKDSTRLPTGTQQRM